VLQHKSLFNGWRLHAACICSANVIVPPPCSTRPSEQPSTAASVSTEPCPGSVVGGERERACFLPFPSTCSLFSNTFNSNRNTNTDKKHITTEHQPFNIQQNLPNSRTPLYRPTSPVPSSCRCRLPSPVVFQERHLRIHCYTEVQRSNICQRIRRLQRTLPQPYHNSSLPVALVRGSISVHVCTKTTAADRGANAERLSATPSWRSPTSTQNKTCN
jgi:hypothetical protein